MRLTSVLLALTFVACSGGDDAGPTQPEPQGFSVAVSVTAAQATTGSGCRIVWKATASDPSVLVTYALKGIQSGTFRGSVEQAFSASSGSSASPASVSVGWQFDAGLWNQSGSKNVSPPPACTVQ